MQVILLQQEDCLAQHQSITADWLSIVMIYCPLLQTTMLFAMPPKAAAKPTALRRQYERWLLVAEPPPAIHCWYCKIVDFAIEPSIKEDNVGSKLAA